MVKHPSLPETEALLGLGKSSPVPKRGSFHVGLNFGSMAPFRLPHMLSHHMLITGGTRNGKSVFAGLLAEMLAEKAGLIFIDPHGSTVQYLLKAFSRMSRMAKRVVYFELDNPDFVLGYNPFRRSGLTETAQVQSILESCLRVWGHEDTSATPTLDRVLRTGFRILLQTNNTFAEARYLFAPECHAEREAILDQARSCNVDPVVLRRWERLQTLRSPKMVEDELLSAFNRISRLTDDEHLRTLLGQRTHCLDLRAIMDEGNILLVNTHTRRGAEVGRLIGMMILNEIFHLAMLRASDGSAKRCHVFVDEFGELASPSVETALPQTGKFNVWFTLILQVLEQLDEISLSFRGKVFGNCHMKVCFGGMSHANCADMTDALFSNQLNLMQPKMWRTYYKPIQKWVEVVSHTRNWSSTTTTIDTQTSGTSRGESEQSGWREGLVEGGLIETFSSGGQGTSKSQSESVTRGQNTGQTVSESETRTPQWITIQEEMQDVAQVWGLPEQRYRATALLQNLPPAVAAIRLKGQPTQIVGIKYVPSPVVRPGGWSKMKGRLRTVEGIQDAESARKHVLEHQGQLFNKAEGPLNTVATNHPDDDPNPFEL